MEVNENIFVSGGNLYLCRNDRLYKHSTGESVPLNFPIKETKGTFYFLDGLEFKKFENLEDLYQFITDKNITSREDILDFYLNDDNMYIVKGINGIITVFKEEEEIVSFKESKYWFFGDFIYYSEDRCLVKYNLLTRTKEVIKKNVIPNILEVYDDLMVMVSHSSIVYIISKDINFTFHKHSTAILGVCRVDNYLYFISKDSRLSVAEINRENRKFLIRFLGEFKKMTRQDNILYILTDVEMIEFDTTKSKIHNYTFSMPHRSLEKIEEKEDEYFELVSMAYKEKKVKREVEPFYKVLNENKYKVEGVVYSFVESKDVKEEELYGGCYKNMLFVCGGGIKEVFSLKGDRLYFHGSYLVSLRRVMGDRYELEVYKYKESRLIYITRKELEFTKVPIRVIFVNDTFYYQIDERYFKTSIVLNCIEVKQMPV